MKKTGLASRCAGPVVFTGLWATWRPPEGEEITSYTIMTTEPNELMAEIHDRMPVILGADDYDRWLDLDTDPTKVLRPCPSDSLEAYGKRLANAPLPAWVLAEEIQ
ncbi:MAG: SOS response-associated peptidase family protein [Alphaproteobacteria bacterium]